MKVTYSRTLRVQPYEVATLELSYEFPQGTNVKEAFDRVSGSVDTLLEKHVSDLKIKTAIQSLGEEIDIDGSAEK